MNSYIATVTNNDGTTSKFVVKGQKALSATMRAFGFTGYDCEAVRYNRHVSFDSNGAFVSVWRTK